MIYYFFLNKMKKIVLSTLLAGLMFSPVMLSAAETGNSKSDLYVGLDVGKNSNTFTVDTGSASGDIDIDSKYLKLKFGTVSESGWRLQGYFSSEKYDEPLFDNTHDRLNEIGVDVIKGFAITPKFSPFIQVGLGYGWMNVDGYDTSSLKEFNVKAGAGLMYSITDMFEVLAGIDFQAKRWSDISNGTKTATITETSRKFYIGTNFHF